MRACRVAATPACSENGQVPSAAEFRYYLNMGDKRERVRSLGAESGLIEAGVGLLRERLPSGWRLDDAVMESQDSHADAVFVLQDPGGKEAQVNVEMKSLVEVRDIPRIVEQSESASGAGGSKIELVVSRYLTKSTRERLSEVGLSYVDATGNLLLRVDSPAVFISDRGADRDPWRGPGRPRGTLKGAPAARVARALLDVPGPWKVRDLVQRSGTSIGSVYRVLEFLEAEALAMRDEAGRIIVPDWEKLLRRWSEDYQFLQTNTVTKWIAPRGIDPFLEKIRESHIDDYAVTGSVAAAYWAAYAPARSAMIYTNSPEQAAAAWGLRPTDTGANVLLARPTFDVVLERTIDRADGLRIAAPTQVAVDLMTGPGRAPAEAQELLDWMKRNEPLWRE